VRLDRHVRRYKTGRVVLSPIDVILDARRALVVQPDLVFVSTARAGICTDRIRGAPDLTIEVLSKSKSHPTAQACAAGAPDRRHDSNVKVKWYRQYGVRECWLVDPSACRIEVINLTTASGGTSLFEQRQLVRSTVLPRLRLSAVDVLDD
jgi:Uma2 family endonuclease